MKKIFGMRKHRDRDRELDKRYRDELEEYEDDFYEDDYPDDEDFEDDDFSDEDYRDDEDYADEDYRDEDDYSDDERLSDERYSDEEDIAEDDEEYPEDVDSERDAGDDLDYEDDDRDYAEDDRDYAEDDRDYAEDERDFVDDDHEYVENGRNHANDRYSDEEYPEENEYPEDEENYEDENYDSEYPEEGEDYLEDKDNYEDEDYNSDYPEDDEDFEDEDYDREYYDDRYEDEYGNEYPYEDYDRDNRRGAMRKSRRDHRRDDDEESVGAKILAFIGRTSAVERIAAVFALLILAGGIATASFYATALNGNKQLESFNDIGLNLTETEMVGKSGLIAVADAEKARAMAAQFVAEEPEEEEEIEVADDAEDVTIKMTVTSIKSDIKVKFINSATGKLVANLPLEIDVVGPDGNTVMYNDHDQDGIIYKKDITKGEYKVTPRALPSGYENYKLELSSKSVTVKDTVEMKAVDVSNEVKKESQVNVAKEDTQVKTEVESVLKDTVEWVESTKTALGEKGDGSYSFEEVSKDKIPNPGSASMVGTRRWMLAELKNSRPALAFLTGNVENKDVSVSPNSIELKVGEHENISVKVGGEEVDANLTSDSDCVEIDGKKITAIKAGSATIKVDVSGAETKTIEVKVEEDKISISANQEMTEGETQVVSISGTSADVKLESSDNSVVSVSDKTIKAEKAGTATIKATGDNCEPDEVTITVKAKEKEKENFSVNGNTVNVKVGESASIGASASSSISYKSQDENIATVDGSGNVKGVKEGNTKITLTAEGYNDGTVNVKVDLKDMKIEISSNTVKVGDNAQIKVSEPSKVTFTSENSDIATVDPNGKVTGVKEGTAKITVKADGYKDASFDVTVTKADLKTMTVEPSPVKVNVSESVSLKVTGPEAGKATFSSKDSNIAKVETDGKITGVSVGNTIITVKSEGYTDVPVNVEVLAKEGNPVPMAITKINIVEGQKIKISAKDANISIRLKSENTGIASISDNTTIVGAGEGEVKVIVSADGYADNTITVKVYSKDTVLKDKDGNEIWVLKSDGDYYKATYEDYYTRDRFYIRTAAKNYKYTGWQTIDGKTYFFDKNGNYVTGEQVIQGAKYSFGADGVLAKAPGAMGIDVSKWNGNIDWNAVKNSGVQFVIIRCGYRGSSAGALIEDSKFKSNIKGAQAAGLKVGVYFFTQAVNEVEAVEEASMVINLVKGYTLSFPVYLDVEGSNGRGDSISASQRTANIKAFCGTIANAGYKAGVYANKTWFTSMINTSQITNYKIWLAQYAQAVTYTGSRYDMWQYTSKGRVTGISGNVDMNICY
ncbi:MAG: hypothetical protein E7306_08280 [Butyrivibrio sp.]|nr:hypothetical protein [Butyrivibrio sp.]